MPLVAGLGNIGSEYNGTRHNIGFRILYELAEKNGMSFKSGKGAYYIASGSIKGKKTYLILPTTFMNRSGTAVQHALQYYKIPIEDCLIVTDDINLDIGRIKIKPKGSAGGHNGLSDIIRQLGTNDYARLRFGVGNNFAQGRQASYVLSVFSNDEIDIVEESVKRSVEAIETWIKLGTERTMNFFNIK